MVRSLHLISTFYHFRLLDSLQKNPLLGQALVNPAAYQARFTKRIDESMAERILQTIEQYGGQGMEAYGDESDEDIIASLVSEQRLRLWWD
jgi:hypothetical protein